MLFNSKELESEARGLFSPRRKLRRSVYLLPTLFTVGNIFFGFYALISTLVGDYDMAAMAIGIAVVLDGLDGRVARMANATSDFGLQLDSLADVVSFGVAPAVLLYTWGMQDLGRLAQCSAFIFLICGAMRLARFNVQTSDLKSFAGLPIPAGAGFVAATVHFLKAPPPWPHFDLMLVVATYVVSFLMISTLRYPSMKKLNLARGKSHLLVVLVALAVAGMIWYSQVALLLVAYTYAASGPFIRLLSALRRQSK
ncbi:MAG TPA: CDP-diacylglycerol--serine O-phosphatidyltransferase [Acidobacteriota bacterium]|nr:CDP-diacylglycerol--serine O-phosphatidyltransferase [Acidobacteriota bacterium]